MCFNNEFTRMVATLAAVCQAAIQTLDTFSSISHPTTPSLPPLPLFTCTFPPHSPTPHPPCSFLLYIPPPPLFSLALTLLPPSHSLLATLPTHNAPFPMASPLIIFLSHSFTSHIIYEVILHLYNHHRHSIYHVNFFTNQTPTFGRR